MWRTQVDEKSHGRLVGITVCVSQLTLVVLASAVRDARGQDEVSAPQENHEMRKPSMLKPLVLLSLSILLCPSHVVQATKLVLFPPRIQAITGHQHIAIAQPWPVYLQHAPNNS